MAERARESALAPLAVCVLLAVGATTLTGAFNSRGYLVAFQIVAFAGLAMAAHGAWRSRTDLRLVGVLLVMAVALQYVGDTGWALNVLVFDKEPFPSWTDAVFVLSYVAMTAAVLIMIRRREQRRDTAALIEAAIITVGVGVVAYAFVIVDAANDEAVTWLSRAVSILYALCDLLIVGVIARMAVGSAAKSAPATLLMVAMGFLLVADVGLVVSVFSGAEDAYGRWVDSAYLLFYLLVGLALRRHDAATLTSDQGPRSERLSPARLAALGAGALLAPLTLLSGGVAGEALKVRGAAVGAGVLFVLTMLRMSQLIRAVESHSELLEVLARTDALTGLPNRRTLDFEFERTADAARKGFLLAPLSVAMIDLDRFKVYNDTHGHVAGDELLRQAADVWTAELRRLAPAATLARYGGEEFAVILPGAPEDAAAGVLRALLPLTPDGQTFSAGVAQWDREEEPAAVLARADLRLYGAKALGRARVVAGAAASAPHRYEGTADAVSLRTSA